MAQRRSTARSLLILCILAAVVGGGAVLRGWRLGAKSLWLREADAVAAARLPWGELVFGPRREDPQPPLFFAALRLWMGGSRDGGRARALSAAASVATLVLVYGLARLMLPWWAALTATGLTAVSGFGVYFAQEARPPALAGFFVALSWYFLAELVAGRRLERWPMWVGLAVSNTAALYASAYAALALAGQLVVLLLVWREVGWRLLLPWLAWQLVPVAAFACYAPVYVERASAAAGGGLGRTEAVAEAMRYLACGPLGELAGRWGTALGVMAVAAAGLVVLVGVAEARRCWTAAAFGLGWLAVPLVGLATVPTEWRDAAAEPGPLLYAAPALALLASVGLAGLRGARRLVPGGLAAVLVGLNVATLALYFRPGFQKERWRQAMAWMTERVEPGDIVCLQPPWARTAFAHCYRGPAILTRTAPGRKGPAEPAGVQLERRTWLITRGADAEAPGALAAAPVLADRRFPGLHATVRLRLFDTRHPRPASPPE